MNVVGRVSGWTGLPQYESQIPKLQSYGTLWESLAIALLFNLRTEAVDEFLAELAALIEPVETHFQWRPQVRDPNDEMVLEAAINGRADALVTFNTSDFGAAGERFGILIVRPLDLLKKVKR